jgi:hypothetical protein
LSAEKVAELQRHIDSCPVCSKYLQEMQADDKLLGDFAEAMQPRMARLENNVVAALGRGPSNKPVSPISMWRMFIDSKITKLAAAAVLLIVVGYIVGRVSNPRVVDTKQFHHALREEWNRDLQLALANWDARLKNELGQQFRGELNDSAVQTLTTSGAMTNELLAKLIEAISAAQTQQRHDIIAALEQMEFNRLRDNSQIRNDFARFAVLTSDELERTRKDVAEWIVYGRGDGFIPGELKSLTPLNERSKK